MIEMKKKSNELVFRHYSNRAKKVFFIGGDGVPSFSSKYVESGSPIGELPTCEISGNKRLVGWFKSTEAIDQVISTTIMEDEDLFLYAVYGTNKIYWGQDDSSLVRIGNTPYDTSIYSRTGETDLCFNSVNDIPWTLDDGASMKFDSDITPVCIGNEEGVRKLSYLFNKVDSITDVNYLHLKYINYFVKTFYGCTMNSIDINNFDIRPETIDSMESCFDHCDAVSISVNGLNTTRMTNCKSIFLACSKATSINITGWVTSKATKMSNMFQQCSKITSMDISGLDTSNAEYISGIFSYCEKLSSVNVNIDTKKAQSYISMFYGCSALTSIDISSFDCSKAYNVATDYMFKNCTNLVTIYTTSLFDKSHIASGYEMFLNSTKLVGGAGTRYAQVSDVGQGSACIDNPPNNKGLFTAKGA